MEENQTIKLFFFRFWFSIPSNYILKYLYIVTITINELLVFYNNNKVYLGKSFMYNMYAQSIYFALIAKAINFLSHG